ncbi:ABC transporter ATP-binding protein [Devosia riboflavina]|uniref:ABC transporter ATP-binding protein n=1 Tax=Devosia riboflavina TaxID=46914 RepID=UPI00068DDE90|nr:ABC transporter ATP-binding protein [Devosia riboflavina]
MQSIPMHADFSQTARPAHDPLVEIEGLKVRFFTDDGVVEALEDVSLTVPRGKTLCIVGESGSGKSITGRALLNQVPSPGKVVGGSIRYFREPDAAPVEITTLDPRGRDMRAIRGGEIGLISQEPMAALSPVHTIGNQMREAIQLHLKLGRKAADAHAVEMLAKVGIPRPAERLDRYSFEFSGGMRQRICIALALACSPRLLIADEPTTALDVTTQANIIDLLLDLQSELGVSVMFITHDLGVVAEIADEIAVMYLGRIVEQGDSVSIFKDPKHPYTRALLRSIPTFASTRGGRLETIRGMVPSPFARPTGCTFNPRCEEAIAGVCNRVVPWPVNVGPGRTVRCHLHADRAEIDRALESQS